MEAAAADAPTAEEHARSDRIATLEEELRRKGNEVATLQESWRIDPSQLELDAFIAEGGEGRVFRGRWRKSVDVAIKCIRREPGKEEEHGFSP